MVILTRLLKLTSHPVDECIGIIITMYRYVNYSNYYILEQCYYQRQRLWIHEKCIKLKICILQSVIGDKYRIELVIYSIISPTNVSTIEQWNYEQWLWKRDKIPRLNISISFVVACRFLIWMNMISTELDTTSNCFVFWICCSLLFKLVHIIRFIDNQSSSLISSTLSISELYWEGPDISICRLYFWY